MFTYEEIYKAYLRCRRGKRNTHNALKFEQNLCENLCDLETSLNNRSYTPKRSVCFLTTSPKFIYDSYSCRVGKGIHEAKKRALKFSRASKYYLQLDIKNFFYTIDKKFLFRMLNGSIVENYHKVKKSKISMHEMLWLVHKIIFHDVTVNAYMKGHKSAFESLPSHKSLFKVAKTKGLPIGNLTSQFFANVYMNDFDNYCKRTLKCKRYLRYVDDFVIFEESREKLLGIQREIESYLSVNLSLVLREYKILKSVHEGLDFLGYIIRPDYVLVRNRVVKNFKYKKAKYLSDYEKQKGTMGLEEIKQFLSVQASFVGHSSHENSYNLIQKVGVIHESNPFDYDRT